MFYVFSFIYLFNWKNIIQFTENCQKKEQNILENKLEKSYLERIKNTKNRNKKILRNSQKNITAMKIFIFGLC